MGATRAAGARVGSTLLLGAVLSLSPAPVEARGWIATWNPDLSAGRHRADFEPTLTRHLDDAFAVVTSTLGIRPAHKIRVHVYGRADYAAKFGQAKARRAGAHYRRGRIHVNGGARIAGWFIGMLHHEMTHAVLDHRGKGRNVPVWMNEGLAEWFDYKAQGEFGLSAGNKSLLRNSHNRNELAALTWRGGLSKYHYVISYAAVLWVAETAGEQTLFDLAKDLSMGTPLAKALDTHLHLTRQALIKAFRRWVGGLSP